LRAARRLRIGAILVLAALPRIWAAVWDQGIFWPDEIFQSLEPAHRFAFGYGFVSWEYHDGARSWLFPGALGLLWKLLANIARDRQVIIATQDRLILDSLGIRPDIVLARRRPTPVPAPDAGTPTTLG
jgi:hypothetical protein